MIASLLVLVLFSFLLLIGFLDFLHRHPTCFGHYHSVFGDDVYMAMEGHSDDLPAKEQSVFLCARQFQPI